MEYQEQQSLPHNLHDYSEVQQIERDIQSLLAMQHFYKDQPILLAHIKTLYNTLTAHHRKVLTYTR